MLLEEFLRPLGLKQPALAVELGVSLNRLNEIVLGKRGITADTAIRLARRFKMSPQFWMRLQADWDLAQALARPRERRRVTSTPLLAVSTMSPRTQWTPVDGRELRRPSSTLTSTYDDGP
jgi:addiction module HigA family antidote